MIYLPEVDAPPICGRTARRLDPDWRADGLEAVVVDDNDDVRVLTGEVLADIGFNVRHASNASEALALCEAGADLVVSDIVMPGAMDGVALARTIRQRWPDMQTILMTGYSEASREAVAAGFRVLRKPFTRAPLLEAISTNRFESAPPLAPHGRQVSASRRKARQRFLLEREDFLHARARRDRARRSSCNWPSADVVIELTTRAAGTRRDARRRWRSGRTGTRGRRASGPRSRNSRPAQPAQAA